MRTMSRVPSIAAAAVLLCMLFLAGCGGGTDGSGVRQIQGTLISSTSADPLADVFVEVEETGDSGVTDAQGMFDIETDASSPTLTLRFQGAGLSASLAIASLPSGNSRVVARVEANVSQNKVTATEVVVVTPTPASLPTSTPEATPTAAIPTPTPTMGPGAQPTATRTPTPNPTPTSTPSGSVEDCRYDLDGNGIIEAADINRASSLFEQGLLGDLNGDGAANSSDLSFFLTGVIPRLGLTCA